MRQRYALLLVALMGLAGLSGCANARYVQVDQNAGIVSIPANTNSWPNYYRDHAETLIRQKCPAGYEVVYEEEAVVGQVAHTRSHTDTQEAPTLGLGGIQTDGNKNSKNGSGSFAGLAIPLGNTQETTRQTTNTNNVTEWRIHYRARSPIPSIAAAPPGPPGTVGPPPPIGPPSPPIPPSPLLSAAPSAPHL
jgi:hypothetical protein